MKVFDFQAALKKKLIGAIHSYLLPESGGFREEDIQNPFEWSGPQGVVKGRVYETGLTTETLPNWMRDLSADPLRSEEVRHLFFPVIEDEIAGQLDMYHPHINFYTYSSYPSYPEPFYRFTALHSTAPENKDGGAETTPNGLRLTREELVFLADLCLDLPLA